MTTKEDDFVEHLFVASTHSYILVFTERGPGALAQGARDPAARARRRGQGDRQPAQARRRGEGGDHGRGARVPRRRASWSSPPSRAWSRRPSSRPTPTRARGGIIAINIDEGDRLLAVRVTDGQRDVLLATAQGLRHPLPGEPTCGRWAAPPTACAASRCAERRPGGGHGGARAGGGDILTVTERGYGKRTPIDEYREQGRGGKGIINLKVTAKTGEVVGVASGGAERRGDPDHPGGQAHPHRRRRHPRDRPLDPGRQGDGPRGRGPLVAIAKVAEREEEGERRRRAPSPLRRGGRDARSRASTRTTRRCRRRTTEATIDAATTGRRTEPPDDEPGRRTRSTEEARPCSFFLDTAEDRGDREGPRMGHGRRRHHQPVADRQAGQPYLDDGGRRSRAWCRGRSRGEVLATEFDAIMKEGRVLAELADNVVVKVPLTPAGLRAVRALRDEGITTNVTLCFSADAGAARRQGRRRLTSRRSSAGSTTSARTAWS